ncbi:MAG: hypothetical protein ACI8RZ_003096 [Myxococcota bacterium]
MTARVFISWSRRDEDLDKLTAAMNRLGLNEPPSAAEQQQAVALRKQLLEHFKALNDAGDAPYHYFVDEQSLAPGEFWQKKIARELNDCHGAVILMSPGAFVSEYTRHEISVLMHRLENEADFVLIPLLLPGALDTWLSRPPFTGSGIQRVNVAHVASLSEALSELEARLQAIRLQRTPHDRLLERIVQLLDGADAGALQQAAHILHAAAGDTPRNIAAALLQADQHTLNTTLKSLALKNVDRGQLQKLAALVTPFSWVPAAVLPTFSSRMATAPRIVLWSGQFQPFTAGQLCQRVYGYQKLFRLVPPALHDAQALTSFLAEDRTSPSPGDAIVALEAELQRVFPGRSARRIRRTLGRGEHILVIPWPDSQTPIPAALTRHLQEQWADPPLLLLCPPESCSPAPNDSVDNIQLLPFVDQETEEDAIDDYIEILDLLST